MIGEVIDRVIAVFSPAKATRRVQARRTLKRSYDAARKDRLTANWSPGNRSADLEALQDADTIRARARDLVRNNAYAEGMLKAIVRNVIGCGIRPQCRLTDDNEQPLEDVNATIESRFDRWQRKCDVTGRLTFYEVQRLVEREVHEAGEVLIRFVRSRSQLNPVGFVLEIIEADRLDTDTYFGRRQQTDSGNFVRRGVELDASGQPVAYHVTQQHPNDVDSLRHNVERVPASQILHLYHSKRIGQTRGVSSFAPVIRWLKDLGYYLENELVSSAVASCFSAVITTLDGNDGPGLGDDIDDDATDADGNRFEYLQPGLVSRLMPGEDLSVVNPSRNGASASEWITLMLRSMAVGMGLSYERLTRDYSKTNYSSNRASDLEDRREFRPEQEFVINHLCVPVWRRFIDALVNRDAVEIDPQDVIVDPERFYACSWQAPGWEWVDPLKEVNAAVISMENGLSTWQDELGKRGKDLLDTAAQIEREDKLKADRGIDMAGSSTSQEPPPPPPEDEEETADAEITEAEA